MTPADKRQRLLMALRVVLGTPQGRLVIAHYCEEVGRCHELSMTGNSQTFFNEGLRAMALEIRRDCLEAGAKEWRALEDEYAKRLSTDAAATDAVAADEEILR